MIFWKTSGASLSDSQIFKTCETMYQNPQITSNFYYFLLPFDTFLHSHSWIITTFFRIKLMIVPNHSSHIQTNGRNGEIINRGNLRWCATAIIDISCFKLTISQHFTSDRWRSKESLRNSSCVFSIEIHDTAHPCWWKW